MNSQDQQRSVRAGLSDLFIGNRLAVTTEVIAQADLEFMSVHIVDGKTITAAAAARRGTDVAANRNIAHVNLAVTEVQNRAMRDLVSGTGHQRPCEIGLRRTVEIVKRRAQTSSNAGE